MKLPSATLKCLIPLFVLLPFFEAKGQGRDTMEDSSGSFEKTMGIQLLGRGLNFFSISGRGKFGNKKEHWVTLNLGSQLINHPLSIRFATTYTIIPIQYRFFRLKMGIGATQLFAFWKKPGESVNPAVADSPFYQWLGFSEVGLHFTLSDKISIEGDYYPIIYRSKNSRGEKNAFKEGLWPFTYWSGLQVNYHF